MFPSYALTLLMSEWHHFFYITVIWFHAVNYNAHLYKKMLKYEQKNSSRYTNNSHREMRLFYLALCFFGLCSVIFWFAQSVLRVYSNKANISAPLPRSPPINLMATVLENISVEFTKSTEIASLFLRIAIGKHKNVFHDCLLCWLRRW